MQRTEFLSDLKRKFMANQHTSRNISRGTSIFIQTDQYVNLQNILQNFNTKKRGLLISHQYNSQEHISVLKQDKELVPRNLVELSTIN